MGKNIIFEPTVELVLKEHNPKHLRSKKQDPYRNIQVSCKNGHTKVVKAALFFDKRKKDNKKLHFCKTCGERLYNDNQG
mgnify:CR=1 FL=1